MGEAPRRGWLTRLWLPGRGIPAAADRAAQVRGDRMFRRPRRAVRRSVRRLHRHRGVRDPQRRHQQAIRDTRSVTAVLTTAPEASAGHRSRCTLLDATWTVIDQAHRKRRHRQRRRRRRQGRRVDQFRRRPGASARAALAGGRRRHRGRGDGVARRRRRRFVRRLGRSLLDPARTTPPLGARVVQLRYIHTHPSTWS